MSNYAALIIDLKKSRSYSNKDRNAIQNYLIETINTLNDVFVHVSTRRVEFSAGDEVQGLFSSPEAAYLYFRLFKMLVSPVEVRAGIGVGTWNVQIDHASTTAQDGPVYHNARHAIDEVKDTLGYTILFYSGDENDIYINSAINTSFIITNSYSEYQNELLLLAELLYPIDVNKIIEPKKLRLLTGLITNKNTLDFYLSYKKSKVVKKYPLDSIENLELNTCSIDSLHDDNTFYVTSGKKRGLSLELANILEISRQSIEKTFKAANIYAVRNATVAALKLMIKLI